MPAPVSLDALILPLRQAGYLSVADELLKQAAAAATGGERVAAISSRLLGLKIQFPSIYRLIWQEGDAWLAAGQRGAVIIPTCPEGGYH